MVILELARSAMKGATAHTISILGGTLFVVRMCHAYGIQQAKTPNPFGLVGNIGTWLIMICIAITLIMTALA